MKKNLFVIDILQLFWKDIVLVQFLGKDGKEIGYCSINYVPKELWYIMVNAVEMDLYQIRLTCDIFDGNLKIKSDNRGRLHPYAYLFH